MLLHIRHETLYRYERLVKYSVQRLHLTPRQDPSQRVLAWQIQAPGRRFEQLDAHNNVAHLLTIEEPHREIRIIVHGTVDSAETDQAQDEGPLSPLAYLAETTLTAPDDAIRALARQVPGADRAPDALVANLCDAVCEAIRYRSGASDVGDSAATALSAGVGVCQDQAHVFIACARLLGIPARYVSGYIYTGDSHDVASHAWVDVWLGREQGWRSVDVTHRRAAVREYCRLAVGRDYLDAAPVRGVRQGGGAETMVASVQVARSTHEQQ